MKSFFNYKNYFQPKADEPLAQTKAALLLWAAT
jgi:hypothetical protein